MIEVINVDRIYYQCESCAKSGEDRQTQVRKITLKFKGSGHGTSFKLCRECFEELQNKF